MVEALVGLILELVFGLTGHALLWVLTGGRWKVSNGRDELATLVGVLFWVVVIVLIVAVALGA